MCHESRCSVIFELDTDTGSLSARVCVCVLEVETHLRSGTKEDVFPRATGVDAAEEEAEVEVVGAQGSVHFHPGWRNTQPAPLYELINFDSGAASRYGP